MKSNIDIVKDYLSGERPLTIVGYEPAAEQKHSVGERWTDATGREWEQKENGPTRVTKVIDIVRAEMDERCSCCGAEIRWGDRHDRKFYNKTGKCFDCLIKEETQLRIKGQYKLYETRKVLENQRSYLLDIRKKLKEAYEYAKKHKVITYVNSNGLVEEWANTTRTELMGNLRKDFVECLKTIREIEESLTKINNEIKNVVSSNG